MDGIEILERGLKLNLLLKKTIQPPGKGLVFTILANTIVDIQHFFSILYGLFFEYWIFYGKGYKIWHLIEQIVLIKKTS